MQLIDRYQRELSELAVTVARRSQAATVEVVDRLARSSPRGTPRPLGRAWRLQFDAAALVREPTETVDGAYAMVERLVALHRQFAQRLLEAMDTRESGQQQSERFENVIHLVPGRHGRRAARR